MYTFLTIAFWAGMAVCAVIVGLFVVVAVEAIGDRLPLALRLRLAALLRRSR